MAYLHFSSDPILSPFIGADVVAPDVTPKKAAASGLTALEWSVVALAQGDRISSLREPSPLSIAFGKVFGRGGRSPNLADPRLEALRRMAVHAWHRGFAVPTHELTAFLRAGFTIEQYETMQASIGAARPARPQRP